MQRKPTICSNPLDLLVKPEKATRKERLTVHLTPSVVERLRNLVYWTPGSTLAGFTEESLVKELDRIEGEQGGPFENRRQELKAGRPVK